MVKIQHSLLYLIPTQIQSITISIRVWSFVDLWTSVETSGRSVGWMMEYYFLDHFSRSFTFFLQMLDWSAWLVIALLVVLDLSTGVKINEVLFKLWLECKVLLLLDLLLRDNLFRCPPTLWLFIPIDLLNFTMVVVFIGCFLYLRHLMLNHFLKLRFYFLECTLEECPHLVCCFLCLFLHIICIHTIILGCFDVLWIFPLRLWVLNRFLSISLTLSPLAFLQVLFKN